MSLAKPTVREALLDRKGGPDRELVLDTFFRRLRLPGGVTKRTRRGRLQDLDALLASHLPAPEARAGRPLELMDVAVSSGVTTLDWAQALRARGLDFRLLAGDRTPRAFLVDLGMGVAALLDDQLNPLQFDVFGRGVPGSAPGLRGIVPWLGRVLVRGALLWDGELRRALRRGRELRGHRPRVAQRVDLTVPELGLDPAIRLIEDDLLAPSNPALAGRFDAIRVANLLNRGYFPEEELRRMLTELGGRLAPGGLLAVCRTEPDDSNHATVFRRADDGSLQVLARLGRGSEVEALAVVVPPALS